MIEEKLTCTCTFEKKDLHGEGTFYGYASVFGVVDHQGDVISSGAFDLEAGNLPLLWQHKQDQPIGKIIQMKETEKGLYLQGKIITEVKQGYEAYKLLQSGVLNGLSIGYVLKDYRIDKKTGTRIITAVKLIEVSLVTFPANEYARVSSVKQKIHKSTVVGEKVNQILDLLQD